MSHWKLYENVPSNMQRTSGSLPTWQVPLHHAAEVHGSHHRLLRGKGPYAGGPVRGEAVPKPLPLLLLLLSSPAGHQQVLHHRDTLCTHLQSMAVALQCNRRWRFIVNESNPYFWPYIKSLIKKTTWHKPVYIYIIFDSLMCKIEGYFQIKNTLTSCATVCLTVWQLLSSQLHSQWVGGVLRVSIVRFFNRWLWPCQHFIGWDITLIIHQHCIQIYRWYTTNC